MIRSLLVVTTVMLTSHPAIAQDSAAEQAAKERLRILELNIQVATEEEKLRKKQAAIAEEARKIAVARAEKAAAEAAENAPRIRIVEAKIMQVSDTTKSCDAKSYLIWACEAKQDCTFDIGPTICPLPAAQGEPMVLSVSFACKEKGANRSFPLRDTKGELTCRQTFFQN